MQSYSVEYSYEDSLYANSGEIPDEQAVYAGNCPACILLIFVGNKNEDHISECTVVFEEEKCYKYNSEY